MHPEIFNANQLALLPFISEFNKEFYLVGGTAIALHIGHRMSIDFDLFKKTKINHKKISESLKDLKLPYQMTYKNEEQINYIINEVKFTFFSYPYNIETKSELKDVISMPDLLTLAAMKAFALGRRTKWKDYVDLYFILLNHFSIKEISDKAEEIYEDMFSSKLFRVQLSYFEGIDYSEEVVYKIGNPPSEDEIKHFLVNASLAM